LQLFYKKQSFLLFFEDYWIMAADFKRRDICRFNIKIVRPFSFKMILTPAITAESTTEKQLIYGEVQRWSNHNK